jgi:glycosyltransferase involved in cell wall biosynthesis
MSNIPYLELDDIIYSLQKFGGASTYWRELTSRLDRVIPASIVRSTAPKIMRLYSPRSAARIFHSSHFRVSSSRGVKNVTTIHDLIYEKGLGGGRAKIINIYERRKSVERADAIICISESTRRDLYEYYGKLVESKPVHVIYHGCTQLPIRSIAITAESKLNLLGHLKLNLSSGNFFMFVGGRSGYKNFKLLLNAFKGGNFASLGYSLICTGAQFSDDEQKLINDLELSKSVFSIGFIDSNTLRELYEVARALVYPSSYEGFGLPPLEAMSAGCPVICSKSSSLPEVVGEAGILIDTDSVDQLVKAMNTVLLDSSRLNYIHAGIERAKNFDWMETARKHALVYKSLVAF